MSEKGWICIGTANGRPLYFNPDERAYAVEVSKKKIRNLTSEELIALSQKRRSAAKQSVAS